MDGPLTVVRTSGARFKGRSVDRLRFSSIAHRDHLFCSPVTSAVVDDIIALLDLWPAGRALDVGCGKAELLIRVIERYGVSGVGVDWSPYFLLEARRRAERRIPLERLELCQMDLREFTPPAESFDLAASVGAGWPGGDYRATVHALAR